MKQPSRITTIAGGAFFVLAAVLAGGYLFLKDTVVGVDAATVRSAYVTIEAESYDSGGGVSKKGSFVTSLDNGDWIRYANVDFGTSGGTGFTAKIAVAPSNAGRKISVRLDSKSATPVGVLTTVSTGDLNTYQDQSIAITPTTGVHTVYLTFSNGSSLGNLDSFVFTKPILVPPSSPSNLSATTQTTSSTTNVFLSWTDNATTETGFIVERSMDALSYSTLVSLPVNTTNFTDLSVPDGTFYYRVKAINTAGDSAYSNIASTTVLTIISPPGSTPPPPPPSPGPAGQDASLYMPTFSDEFEGTTLDTSKWNDHIWYETSDPVINYAVENGALEIWPDVGFKNRTIDTDGKYYQTYGFFEVEAKLPVGKGPWPAFWIFNHPGNLRPEIDIMEAYSGGGPSSGWSDANLHPVAYGATIWPTGASNSPAGSKMIQTPDLSAGFHKYGLKWEPNKQTFYFDGVEVYSLNVTMSTQLYILLDLWFGSASGQPDSTTPTGKGNAYVVNYVRAWQFK